MSGLDWSFRLAEYQRLAPLQEEAVDLVGWMSEQAIPEVTLNLDGGAIVVVRIPRFYCSSCSKQINRRENHMRSSVTKHIGQVSYRFNLTLNEAEAEQIMIALRDREMFLRCSVPKPQGCEVLDELACEIARVIQAPNGYAGDGPYVTADPKAIQSFNGPLTVGGTVVPQVPQIGGTGSPPVPVLDQGK